MMTKSSSKKKSMRCLMAVALSGILIASTCLADYDQIGAAESVNNELHNPVVEMNTCDTVYFGEYWQEDTDGNGVINQNDDKMPIRWRILSKNGNDAYVIADQVLDCKQYHETEEIVNWENSSLREWLNQEFYHAAFSTEEKDAIQGQTLENSENEGYRTSDEQDLVDQISLPSVADMINLEYGFSGNAQSFDQARVGKATAYAEGQGVQTVGSVYAEEQEVQTSDKVYAKDQETGSEGVKNSWWWLRSSGKDMDTIAYVGAGGFVDRDGSNHGNFGVRPTLCLDLSSPLVQNGEQINTSLKTATWDLVELGSLEGKPITWRVLSISEQDAFLLSDQILANQKYHESDFSILWKDTTLRKWLNGDFYQKAFSEEEKSGILWYQYPNSVHPWFGTGDGEDTEDFISLLSNEDIVNLEYGFPTEYDCDHQARIAYSREEENAGIWWLRSPGFRTEYAVNVFEEGNVEMYGNGIGNLYGIRPVLHWNIATHPLTKTGTVTAEVDKEYREEISNTTEPTKEPSTTEKPEITQDPENTKKPSETDQPEETKQPGVTDQPEETEKPGTTDQPKGTENPGTTDQPEGTEKPGTTDRPNVTNSPVATDPPGAAKTPGSNHISGSGGAGKPSAAKTPSEGTVKNYPTKVNIKNNKKYSISKKLTIRDADGIRSVKINGKAVKIKKGKKKVSFKLSKYKKLLKEKAKWNRLVIIDKKGNKKTIRFKIK